MRYEAKSGTQGDVSVRDAARARAYRSARSHSGRVRAAKLALPALGVLSLLVMGGWMWLSRVVPDIGVDFSGSSIRDGKLIMANPKLDGYTTGDQSYTVKAARAIQELTGGGGVTFEEIEATVQLDAEQKADVLAGSGRYEPEANTLVLSQSIEIESTNGIRASLQSAKIDLEGGRLTTRDPVRISMPGGSIEAGELKVRDSGRHLLFESGVKLVVEPALFQPDTLPEIPDDVRFKTGD